MKPYCDRPLCVRTRPHQHVEGPETVPGDSLSDETAVPSPVEAGNGYEGSEGPEHFPHFYEEARRRRLANEERERDYKLKIERTPGTEVTGGASPEVEAGDAATLANWREAWERTEKRRTDATAALRQAEAERVETLRFMRARGASLQTIAEVTGLSRQRVGQILGAK